MNTHDSSKLNSSPKSSSSNPNTPRPKTRKKQSTKTATSTAFPSAFSMKPPQPAHSQMVLSSKIRNSSGGSHSTIALLNPPKAEIKTNNDATDVLLMAMTASLNEKSEPPSLPPNFKK